MIAMDPMTNPQGSKPDSHGAAYGATEQAAEKVCFALGSRRGSRPRLPGGAKLRSVVAAIERTCRGKRRIAESNHATSAGLRPAGQPGAAVPTRGRAGIFSKLALLAGFGLVLAGLATSIPASAQQLAKRLILKDGSYQLVTKYEVTGDRVRYYSAERGEWEELPNSLVDWAATEKYEKDRASGAPPKEAAEIDRELEAERKADEAKSPVVAPGLRLPEDGGVFLLDTFQGQSQLAEVQQNGGQINKNMKGNILRAAINPIASSKQTVELEGAHAKIQSHVTRPTLYVNIAQDSEVPAEQPQKTAYAQKPNDPLRFRIVRMQTKQNKRIVGAIKIAVYGKVSQQQNLVPAKDEVIPGSAWVKVTPDAPLSPGEYAVVEMLGEEGMNLYVWDFGVNPSAPANAGAWKPDRSASPQPEKPAELQKR